MSVLIGGGTGFIGRHLQKCLKAKGYVVKVVSRSPGNDVITWSDLERNGLPEGVTAVVNLSGENLLNPQKRWNESFKQTLISSRVNPNKQLVELITNAKQKPQVWISTSAVGYYPASQTAEYTEDSTNTDRNFFSDLCIQVENSAALPLTSAASVRHVIVRVGIALGRDGGTIQQLYLPFFCGLGGRVGSGKQWFPWIHVDDVAGIYVHAIENANVTGVLNAVAPQAATNAEFTAAFASAMWRPAFFSIPSAALKFIYGSELASVILEGHKVVPKRTLELGYKFQYPDLASACQEFSRLVAFGDLRN